MTPDPTQGPSAEEIAGTYGKDHGLFHRIIDVQMAERSRGDAEKARADRAEAERDELQACLAELRGHNVIAALHWGKALGPRYDGIALSEVATALRTVTQEAEERGFRAGYHASWDKGSGYSFDPIYSPGDPDGAWAAYRQQQECKL